jgi:hypothetical protein
MSAYAICSKDYKKVDQEDIDFLIGLLGKDRVFTGDEISHDFSHDELAGIQAMPEVLVEVASTRKSQRSWNMPMRIISLSSPGVLVPDL